MAVNSQRSEGPHGEHAHHAGHHADLESIFAAERDERLSSMEHSLLVLEQAGSERERAAALEMLLRDAHSLKGAAQLLEKTQVAEVTHTLETRLQQMTGRLPSDAELDMLLRTVDELRSLASDVGEPDPAANSPVQLTLLPAVRGPDGRPADPAEPVEIEGRGQDQQPADEVVRVPARRLDALLARSADLSEIREASDRQRAALRSIAEEMMSLSREVSAVRARARVAPSAPARPKGTSRELMADLERLEDESTSLQRTARRASRSATVHSQRVARVASDFESELLELRMVPVETLLRGFRRMVRELARQYGKEVVLEGVGWGTPIDRGVAARLKDPVMHLLRNAIVHGIEHPEARELAGKSRTGRVTVVAGQRGGNVVLEVRDDGAGIDVEAVQRRALADGRIDPEATVSTRFATELILEPQFSTTERVDAGSGRGVGLDVVRTQVTELGGTLDVETERGQGTSFVLRLPLTLVSQHVVVVRVGARRYGLPLAAVSRIVSVAPGGLTDLGSGTVLADGGESLLLVDGARLLEVADDRHQRRGSRSLAVVMSTPSGRVAVAVDGLEGEREVVIRDLGSMVRGLPLYAGAAAIEDESLLLVLDPTELIARALALPKGGDDYFSRPAADTPARILVVDDSITTRTLEKNILAAAGFDVLTAVDGTDALGVLRRERVDLVLSDIEMPRMDGLRLSKRIKGDARLRDVPVLLVSGVDREHLRETALAAGADAFLAKADLDQRELLRVIGELTQ